MDSSNLEYSSIGHVVVERETYAWWWRLIAFLSMFLILGGFVSLQPLFATDSKLRSSEVLLTVITVAFLTAGFSLTGLLCFACRDARYQLDVILTPALFSTVTGLFSVLYTLAVSSNYKWEVASIVGVVLGITGSVIYFLLCVLAYRRHLAPETSPSSLPGKRLRRLFNRNAPSSSLQNPTITIVPGEAPVQIIKSKSRSEEDELTRQQMLSLLKARENIRGRGSDASLRTTYNIELPPVQRSAVENRLSMPAHVREYYNPLADPQTQYQPLKAELEEQPRQDGNPRSKRHTVQTTAVGNQPKVLADITEVDKESPGTRDERRMEIENADERARSRSRDLRRREIELGRKP